ncbi:MAG: hypothetical protein R2861_04220 [Desulfobacterales bacterium]
MQGLKQKNPGISLFAIENKIYEYDYDEAIDLLMRHLDQRR